MKQLILGAAHRVDEHFCSLIAVNILLAFY